MLLNFLRKHSRYSSIFYSQEGEDILLKRIFNNQSRGFYVDIGAHHAIRFSNTYGFYREGWRGINVEPNPESFSSFKKIRTRDININCGVGKQVGILKYFIFDEPALNTFDLNTLESRIKNTPYKHIETLEVKVTTLADILNNHLPKGEVIDFLTVDVEGFDLEVLQSNDWSLYRPKWILVEQLNLPNIEVLDFDVHLYMKSLGYELFAKTFNTLFYKDKSF